MEVDGGSPKGNGWLLNKRRALERNKQVNPPLCSWKQTRGVCSENGRWKGYSQPRPIQVPPLLAAGRLPTPSGSLAKPME